ncbi:transposase [Cucumis melo var. makuwa]|uniref:Transposase n=1 Tax=Cucumis melo var. makuwa TaxID=1194695 RepID=A0A5D3CFI8_CUCMM|nr:transposase [Cucumis melo var. makuwa]
MSRKGYANLADKLTITHDVSYRSTLWKEARKGRNNDYFDDATRDCASRIIELVATHKNEDILTDALGSKEHGRYVKVVGGFVSQSQYFNTIKGKEKMITSEVEICHKEEDDTRCKSYKKKSNHSRSSIESINIDLDVDEDLVNTSSNKGVEGKPCQLSIGSINNIVAVATVVEDNIGCPNVKVLSRRGYGRKFDYTQSSEGKDRDLKLSIWEHSTRKDVVYSSNYNDVNGTIKLLNRHVVNNMKDVDMIHIPMNELIFGSDKFFYLAREDLLHYCGMVEIGYVY